jgi:ribosomal protein S18 acetylase RimI-like enzyme
MGIPNRSAGPSGWTVTPLRADDQPFWQQLYRGYGEFYEVAMPQQKLDRVWSWLHDDAHELRAIVVRAGAEEPPVGLAHYRPFARPLHGSTGCYLDDLFVEPAARGTGAVDALLAELRALAGRHGWDVVRWITSETNLRARSTYDRLARRTGYLTYDMPPEDTP